MLELTGLPSIYTLLRQRRMKWLGHVHSTDVGRIPNDLLYGKLRQGVRGTGRPLPTYKDVCKNDFKKPDINELSWETSAADRDEWKRTLKRQLPGGERNWIARVAAKQVRRKIMAEAKAHPVPIAFICPRCDRDFKARIGHLSHTKMCRA